VFDHMREDVTAALQAIRASGQYKSERVLDGPQAATVKVGGSDVLNFCANNYLGLADDPDLIAAAGAALADWGYGLASVRFICGTQQPHRELEARLSSFLGTEATILYSSCFDANAGVFEPLLDERDAVISDALNHASIIDGIRLCKARRFRYDNRDLADLERCLIEAADARYRLIATDGVFSMDGHVAPLADICALADRHQALVLVDDSHAVGVLGDHGRGTADLFGVRDQVDLVTGTLGKALGGATGGYVSGRGELIELLRQRSRPYLFSNSLAPAIAAASLVALDLVYAADDRRDRLRHNAHLFRSRMTELGFDVIPGQHPIVPVMLGDAAVAVSFAERLLARGVYAIAFSYPVVPVGRARIRIQLSAAHTTADVERAIDAFADVRAELGEAPRLTA
jgi:glycine C-acetyltransferase